MYRATLYNKHTAFAEFMERGTPDVQRETNPATEYFSEMEAARLQGTYDETITRLCKVPLMISDDFLLLPTKPV